MAARLTTLICTKQKETARAAHLSIRTRVDKGARTYVQSPKTGPDWDPFVRRVTMTLDGSAIIQDTKIQDQPIGCNHNAPLPNGVTYVRTRLYWEQPEPVLIGHGDQRPRPRRGAFVDDDRHLPLRLSVA
eukprot:3180069-Pyramimonas_sp.AAC.1